MRLSTACIAILSAAVATVSAAPAVPSTSLAPRGLPNFIKEATCQLKTGLLCAQTHVGWIPVSDANDPITAWRDHARTIYLERRGKEISLNLYGEPFDYIYGYFKVHLKQWLAVKERVPLSGFDISKENPDSWVMGVFGLHLAWFSEHMVVLKENKRAELFAHYSALADHIASFLTKAPAKPKTNSCEGILGYMVAIEQAHPSTITREMFGTYVENVHDFLYAEAATDYYFEYSAVKESSEGKAAGSSIGLGDN